jgi:hypothetical protein
MYHLAEDEMEFHLMGRLPLLRSIAIEDHAHACPKCKSRLEETEVFLQAIQDALLGFSSGTKLEVRHRLPG